MKKFKKYLKFLFVLPLFIFALFVNLTISADEFVVADNTVNTNSLLSFDFSGNKLIDCNANKFFSAIQSSTFTNQNYSYDNYYNVDLSFIDKNNWENFPDYLNNFYLRINGVIKWNSENYSFNTIVKCDMIKNFNSFYGHVVEEDGTYGTKNTTSSVHFVSSFFDTPVPSLSGADKITNYIDLTLWYKENDTQNSEYIGSKLYLACNDIKYYYLQELHFELFNDLTTFNTYLDSLYSGGGYDLGFNDGYTQGYDLGFNDGYTQGYEQGVIDSTPSANITDNLFLSYGIYSNDNQILVNDLFNDSDFTQLNELKPGIIYNLITDEGASANTILIFLKNIESNSGYILNMFNGDYGSFELKILGNGGKVLYTNVYDSTSYEISQLLSVVGDNIIIDAISFTFQDIENAENFYISFTNTLLNETFQNGFNVGIFEGESIGYDKGYDDGYRLGHSNGYNEGMSSQFNLGSTLLEIADIPIKVLSSMLSFEVLGINVFGLFTGLVTVLVVLWVVKKFIV